MNDVRDSSCVFKSFLIHRSRVQHFRRYPEAYDELWVRTSATGKSPWIPVEWMDEAWRTKWIERMERRE